MPDSSRTIRMPSLGAEMEEGTLLEWYVEPGDEVAYGQVIALLDTEKAEIEMESFDAGTIEALLIVPGQTVSVGEPIATLTGAAPAEDRAPATPPPRPSAPPIGQPKRVVSTPPRALGTQLRSRTARVRATPLARRLAQERGLDLARLTGSGVHGAIVEADVRFAVRPRTVGTHTAPTEPTEPTGPTGPTGLPSSHDAAPDAPPPSLRESPSRAARRRDIIAAAMTRSKREIPHYYLSTHIAADLLTTWLERMNEGRAARNRIATAAMLLRAVALAARRFPEMNGHWLDDGFKSSEAVHLGVVVSLRTGGIVIPTLQNAHLLDPESMMSALRDVVGRARAGRLRSGELGQATVTVTNLGEDGVETVFGIIYPPQVAIVGFGGLHTGARDSDGLVGPRSHFHATLAADHRVSDGQQGSRFLREIARSLENPEVP